MSTNLIDHNSPFLNDIEFKTLSDAEKATVEALIDVSSTLIRKECNREFPEADYTDEPYDGDGLNNIFIRNLPLNSISGIKVKPDQSVINLEFDQFFDWWAIAGTEIDYTSDIFEFNIKTGEIWFKPYNLLTTPIDNYLGYFPKGRQNILISYNGGFDGVPSPIQMLCADLVKASFAPEDVFGNIDSEKLGQYFYKTKKGVMENVLMANKRIISLYKIRKV